MAALERLRALVPADVPFVADAKRGDIGSTAARQAVALFDVLGADAVTVNPYLGEEAIAPLLERADRFAYVLCRTSNPGAAELQGLAVAADAPPAIPRSRSGRVSPAARRPGARAAPWASSSAPRHPPSWPRSARSRPASRSSSRASVPRAARSRRCSRPVPRPPRRRGAGPAAACSSTSRGASRGRPWAPSRRGRRGTPASASRRPPPVGREPRCATLTPSGAAEWHRSRTRSNAVMPFINGIGPGELIIVLIIALIVVGPGKLPDVGSALGKSIREFRKAATDVKESTSLDPGPPPRRAAARAVRRRRAPAPRATAPPSARRAPARRARRGRRPAAAEAARRRREPHRQPVDAAARRAVVPSAPSPPPMARRARRTSSSPRRPRRLRPAGPIPWPMPTPSPTAPCPCP